MAAETRRTQVLIAGAGPAGLFLAALLAQRGVEVTVLERRTASSTHSRGIGLHPPALTALAAVGLDAAAVAEGVTVATGAGFSGGRRLGELSFERTSAAYPYILVLPQNRTEALLAARVEVLAPGAVHRGVEVTGLDDDAAWPWARVTGRTADGETVRWEARVVVAADGTRSRLRRLSGVGVRVRGWPDRYLMADVLDTTDAGAVAHIHVHRDGVVESFPLPEGVRRWVVHTGADLLPEDAGLLAELVRDRTGERVDASSASMVSAFGVRRLVAERMVAGRTVLMGDAAHAVSPIGGQGMTLGWLDARELAPLLEQVLTDGDGDGVVGDAARTLEDDPRFATFQRRRLRVATAAARQAEVNMVLGRSLPAPARVLRDAAARAVLASPLSGLLAWTYSMGWARLR